MIRSIIRDNAIRAHRLRIFARLPGAPMPGDRREGASVALEDLDPITRDCWEMLFDFERKNQEVRP